MKKNDYIRLSEKYIRDEATEEERERLFDWIRHNEKINRLMLKRLEQAACDVDHDTEMRMYEHIRTSILPKNKQVCLNRVKRFDRLPYGCSRSYPRGQSTSLLLALHPKTIC